MADLILGLILLALIGAAVGYIVKAKKKGVKCIGCPDGAACSRRQEGGCCSCSGSVPDDFKIKK
ncbi:MAG: FeoB-associated Cys-rich membrane protein [Anaerovoracaceae bacterium]